MKSYQDKAGRIIQILEETDVLVIGAGLGGICAALSAASAGYHVVLAEKNAVLGGQAAEIDTWGLDGFVNRNGKLVVKGYPWKILQETVKEGGSDPLFENIDLDVMERQGIDQALHAINLDEYIPYINTGTFMNPFNDQFVNPWIASGAPAFTSCSISSGSGFFPTMGRKNHLSSGFLRI